MEFLEADYRAFRGEFTYEEHCDFDMGEDEYSNFEMASNDDPQMEESTQSDDLDMVPHKGQTFSSDDDAYKFFANFAKKNGFSIRRERSLGHKGHPLGYYRRTFTCHRAGYPRPQKVSEIEKQRNRKSSRCGCAVKMLVYKTVVDGLIRWTITEYFDVHNHELLKNNEVRFLPAYRHIDDVDKQRILLLVKAGCSVNIIMRILELEKNMEPGHLSFTERDVKNFIQGFKDKGRESDASELLMFCKAMKDEDSDFCYNFELDESQRLKHIAWSFGDSVRAFDIFGDVIVFDTTYRINHYEMPLGVWVGVNHHGNTIFLGCVLLHDEKATSFSWALQSFSQFMKGKYPQTILTDQDLAMKEAIAEVWPRSKHAFCIWHISSKLSGYFSFPLGENYEAFKTKFYDVYHSDTEEKFETGWQDMITQFQLGEDRHISLLYSHRFYWALPYLRPYFFAGMTTTGRSESMNAFLKKYLNAKTRLRDFIEQVKVASTLRNIVAEEATMQQKYQCTKIKTCMPIEEHASRILTPYAFDLLQEEIILSNSYAMIEVTHDSYMLKHHSGVGEGRIVTWHQPSEEIFCSCKEFEFGGILCRHAIRVLVGKNYFQIPDKYLPLRWRRENSVLVRINSNNTQPMNNEMLTFKPLYDVLYDEAFKTKQRHEYAKKELTRVIQSVRDLPECEDYEDNVQISSNEIDLDKAVEPSEFSTIENPLLSKTKGRPRNKRLVGGVEVAKKPRYCKVPNCGGTNHDSRNCPNKKRFVEVVCTQSPNKIKAGLKNVL